MPSTLDPSPLKSRKPDTGRPAAAAGRFARPRPFAQDPACSLAGLVMALEAREAETSLHSIRVAGYAILLAARMGLPWREVEAIRRGALLHDIGKIGVSDSIFRKPGRLCEEEWDQMKRHTTLGYRMLLGAGYPQAVAEIALSHHEKWDGTGYPERLRGQTIPLHARIVGLADSLDAMTADRCYRRALPFAVASREIQSHAGSQFDPSIVDHFLQIAESEWVTVQRQPYSALSPWSALLGAV